MRAETYELFYFFPIDKDEEEENSFTSPSIHESSAHYINDLAAKMSKIFLKFHPFYVNVARKLPILFQNCTKDLHRNSENITSGYVSITD